MKRMIKASVGDNFKDACFAIDEMIFQAYENYGDECSDDELYRIVEDYIADGCEPSVLNIWKAIKKYVISDYRVEELCRMTYEQAANLFNLLYMVHNNDR